MRHHTKAALTQMVAISVLIAISVWLGFWAANESARRAEQPVLVVDTTPNPTPVIIHQVLPDESVIPKREEIWLDQEQVDEQLKPLTVEEFDNLQKVLKLSLAGNLTVDSLREVFPDATDEELIETIAEVEAAFLRPPLDPVVQEQETADVEDSEQGGNPVGSDEADHAAVQDVGPEPGDLAGDGAGASEPISPPVGLPDPEKFTREERCKFTIASPVTWTCFYCDKLKGQVKSAEAEEDLPFDVEFKNADGLGRYPKIEMTKPGTSTVIVWTNRNPPTLQEMNRVHRMFWVDPPASPDPGSKPGPEELRQRVLTHNGWLPTSGTVVGKTVRQHLLDEHHYEAWQIAGLPDTILHGLHQITHNATDHRQTASPPPQNRRSGNQNWSYQWSSGYQTAPLNTTRFRRRR